MRTPPPSGETSFARKAATALFALVNRLRDAGVSRVKAMHAALGLSLTIGLAAGVLVLWGVAQLTGAVLQGETVAFDHAILNWMHAHSAPWLDQSAIEATALGSMVVLVVIGLALSVVLWHLERRRHVAMIWFAVMGSVVLNQAMKAIFNRSRPDVFQPLMKVGSLSFPSGHAMNAMVFYTVVAFAIGHVVGPGAVRRATYVFGALLIAVVGLTRVYIGVHFPSDVIAGYSVGYCWALLCAVMTEAWGKRLETMGEKRA